MVPAARELSRRRCRIPFAALTRAVEQRPSLAAVFCRNACSFLAKRLRRILLELSFARELNERHF
jgi:hypothetical protein